MSNFDQRITVTFGERCFGTLINSLGLWIFGQAGITAQFGGKLAPSLSPQWLSFFLYRSKDGKKENIFDALEWLAAMCSHVPNKGEQMVRHYGYFNNVRRGKRIKQNQDDMDILCSEIRRIIKRAPDELGQVYPPRTG